MDSLLMHRRSTTKSKQDEKAAKEAAEKETKLQEIMKDPSYNTPLALDIFMLETKARKTIGELIRPIHQHIEKDRLQVAAFMVRLEEFMQRLDKIEFTVGINGSKP